MLNKIFFSAEIDEVVKLSTKNRDVIATPIFYIMFINSPLSFIL